MKLNKIKSYKNWINWNINKKKPKIPHNSRTGEYAKNDDPSTWTTYEVAKNFAPCVGFEFSNVPVIGIDIDNCLDTKTGKMSELAKHVVEVMKSYTEISQSGTGLHILVFVDDKTGFKNHKRPLHEKGFDSQGIEFYKENCCIALTENSIKDFELENRQAETEKIYAEYFKHLDVEPVNIVHLDSNTAGYMPDDLDEIAFNAMMSKPKNKALWEGEHSVYPSQSEADLAFCGLLAWYFNEDARKMDFYFRKSGLMREKWDRPQKNGTYGEVVISKAIAGNNGCYNAELFSEQGRILFSFAVAKLLNNSFDTALELFKKKAAETVSDETAKLIWANAQNSHAYQSQKRLQEKLTSDNGNKELVITDETLEKHSENELITLASKYDVVKLTASEKTDNFAYLLFKNGIYFDYDNKDGIEFLIDKLFEKRPIKGRISKEKRQENEGIVKDFVQQLKKNYSADENVLIDVAEKFTACYGKTYTKKLFKDKSERELVREYAQSIISKYHPKSYGESTHREYLIYQGDESGYWRNYSSGDLWSLIIKEHGIDNTLAKKVEDAIYPHPDVKKFDDEIINFGTPGFLNLQNGVLDLKTNEILPHDAKYMFDYVLPVKFDKNATCPLFKKFLNEFSNFNNGRLQTVRDMIGYIFTFEDKEHRIFNLYGSGRNGKGTLFRVFDAIFGKYSTHLSPTQMLSAFERIKLQNSLINISTDINVRIDNKSCEYLKKVSGKDMIDGNLKYKNSKDFSSHATLILAFNKIPLFEDNSEGFYDRHIYIKCENCFKGRENLKLDKELESELSGILNFFLQCARDFVANGCRVRQYEPDAKELSKKISVENDIVAAFLDDKQPEWTERLSCTFTTNELYEMFVNWLDETRNRKVSMPRNKLTSEIKRITGLETRQAGAGENRGKYVFDFSPLIEKETQQVEVVSDTESEMQKQWDNFITFAKSKGKDYPDEIAGRVEFNYSIQDFRDYWLKSAENDRQKGDENGAGISLEHAQIAIEFLRQAG